MRTMKTHFHNPFARSLRRLGTRRGEISAIGSSAAADTCAVGIREGDGPNSGAPRVSADGMGARLDDLCSACNVSRLFAAALLSEALPSTHATNNYSDHSAFSSSTALLQLQMFAAMQLVGPMNVRPEQFRNEESCHCY